MGAVKEPVENYDLMTAVMICLGGTEDKNYGGILRFLEVLLSNERGAEEKKRILQDEFRVKMEYEIEKEVEHMGYVGSVFDRKIEKKVDEFLENMIGRVMRSTKCTREEAIEILEIDEAIRANFIQMIKESPID